MGGWRVMVVFALGACAEDAADSLAVDVTPAAWLASEDRIAPRTDGSGQWGGPAGSSIPMQLPESMAVLGDGLQSRDWMTRWTATSALGCVAGEQALVWLEGRLADPEEDVRAEAIAGLARRASARARALLASVQSDTKEKLSLRVLAASALVSPVKPCR